MGFFEHVALDTGMAVPMPLDGADMNCQKLAAACHEYQAACYEYQAAHIRAMARGVHQEREPGLVAPAPGLAPAAWMLGGALGCGASGALNKMEPGCIFSTAKPGDACSREEPVAESRDDRSDRSNGSLAAAASVSEVPLSKMQVQRAVHTQIGSLPVVESHDDRGSQSSTSSAAVASGFGFPLPKNPRQGAVHVQNGSLGSCQVHWAVNSQKFSSRDKQVVSPEFGVTLPGHEECRYKIVIYATATNDQKYGASFSKAKGRGRISLCCKSDLDTDAPGIAFSIAVGSGHRLQAARGPVAHRFTEKSFCGLPAHEDEWNFGAAVTDSGIVWVSLQLAPLSAPHEV